MKAALLSIATGFVFVLSATAADVKVTISDAHVCCQNCVKGAQKAVAPITGAKADASIDDDTVTITAPDKATLQKATDALIAAGYFGTSSDPDIKINAKTNAKNVKVSSVTIADLHLCCDKCAKAVNKIVMAVPGVKAQTAVKNAKTFDVTGDFNDKDLMDALQKGGLTGTITKEM